MKQEEKELLLKDLCSRLPYNPMVEYKSETYNVLGITQGRLVLCKPFMSKTLDKYPLVEEVKPYLFPLSSMTDEQEREFKGLLSEVYDFTFRMEELLEFIQSQENIPFHFIDWLAQNNFDYRGLIPMGLAIDATNLNIY